MNFYIKAHQHKASAVIRALREGRHSQTANIRKCDIAFLDYCWHGVWAGIPNQRIRAEALVRKPLFLYPHSVRPELPYDIEPFYFDKVRANFVIAEGHKEVLRMLDYPCPVEVMGWSYTQQKPFIPQNPNGKIKVLFAPIHPIGRYLPDDEKQLNADTFRALLELTDEIELSVRYIHKLEYNGLWADGRVTYYASAPNGRTEEIENADVVIGAYTFASIAVSLGKPLIMMADRLRSHNTPMGNGSLVYSRRWEKYAEYKRYPFNIEDVLKDGLFSMIQRVMTEPATEWRDRFIGKDMDAVAFVRKVEEYCGL